MNPFDTVASEQLCLGLLHSLWQVPLCAFIAWAISRCLRGREDIAYMVHTAALAAAAIAVPVTCLLMPADGLFWTPSAVAEVAIAAPDRRDARRARPPAASVDRSKTVVATDGSAIGRPAGVEPTVRVVQTAEPVTLDGKLAEPSRTTLTGVESGFDLRPAIPWFVGVYLLGVTLMLVRLARSAISVDRLRARAENVTRGPARDILDKLCGLGSKKLAPVLAHADHVAVPQIVGLLRPAILLPTSALTGLPAGDLELILAHELAHLRRHDMWVNLFQRFVEAALFFNPGVWWLSRQISTLREFCCDDRVCATMPERNQASLRYAAALLHMAELSKQVASMNHHASCTSEQLTSLAAAGNSPSELRRRVARLFDQPIREPMPLSAGSVLGGLLIVVGILLGPAIWQAQAQTGDATTPQTIEAESDRWLRVQIVGPDGDPVPGVNAEVRRLPDVASRLRVGEVVKQQQYGTLIKADESGKLGLDLDDIELSAVHLFIREPGYGPYYARWSRRLPSELWSSEVTLKLEKAWSVGGVVVNTEGQPVAGATVHPSLEYKRRPGDNGQLGVGKRIKTDENGSWRFDSVPISETELAVEIMHPEYSSTSLALERHRYQIDTGAVPSEPIEMTTGISVSGRVVDASGNPIEGATVRTEHYNDLRTATTDRDGNYRLVGCQPMTSRIVVSASGMALDMKEVEIRTDMLPVNFQMRPGGKIRVRVVDEDGKGIPKARIFFQRWRGHIDYFEFDHINQYADDQGVWEWTEAPLDAFEADICRPGGMQLTNQKLVAREKEYVFSPPRTLEVHGNVTDAETGKPIQVFQAIQGEIRDREEAKIWWEESDPYRATEGKYRVQFKRVGAAAKVRVEAPGYEVAVSRDVRRDEGDPRVDFALRRQASVAVTLLAPDGQPAADADVAIGIASAQIAIDNGRFTSQTYAQRVTADKSGRFEFPNRVEPFELVILHEAGFSHVKSTDGPIPNQITLTPWARVEGVYRIGDQPVPGVSIDCSGGIHASGPGRPSLFTFSDVKTDTQGRYVFDRMFPGRGRLGREILRIVNQGFREKLSSSRVPYEVAAGQRLRLDLGGSGRAVVGQLAAPKGHTTPVSWNFGELVLTPGGPQPKWPDVPPEIQDDVAKQQQWYKEWSQSPDGKTRIKQHEKWQAMRDASPEYNATVGSDGSFRIDDVPPGKYMLECRDYDQKLPGTLERQIDVPDGEANDRADLDLGVLTLETI